MSLTPAGRFLHFVDPTITTAAAAAATLNSSCTYGTSQETTVGFALVPMFSYSPLSSLAEAWHCLIVRRLQVRLARGQGCFIRGVFAPVCEAPLLYCKTLQSLPTQMFSCPRDKQGISTQSLASSFCAAPTAWSAVFQQENCGCCELLSYPRLAPARPTVESKALFLSEPLRAGRTDPAGRRCKQTASNTSVSRLLQQRTRTFKWW